MSRVLVVTAGLAEEVKPYVSIVDALIGARTTVGVICYSELDVLFADLGVEFYPLAGSSRTVFATEQARDAFWNGKRFQQLHILRDAVESFSENYNRIWDAVKSFQPEIILCSTLVLPETLASGQRLQIPVLTMSTAPLTPSREYAPVSVFTTPSPLPPVNALLHTLAARSLWGLVSAQLNRFRTAIGLPEQDAMSFTATPVIHLYSEAVFPRPGDWGPDAHVVGFVPEPGVQQGASPSAETSVPTELVTAGSAAGAVAAAAGSVIQVADSGSTRSEKVGSGSPLDAFLAEGPPPLLVAFHTAPIPHPAQFIREILSALAQLNARAIVILSSDWTDLDSVSFPPSVLQVQQAPFSYDLLLPRCSAVIHYGAPDMLSAVLRAGVPSVLFPIYSDQPFWARRLAQCGLGSGDVVRACDVTASVVVTQVREALTEQRRTAARTLSERLRQEDACTQIVQLVHLYSQRLSRHGRSAQQWEHDEDILNCRACAEEFSFFRRRHHCRSCGRIFCARCMGRHVLPNYTPEQPPLVCLDCIKALEMTRRTNSTSTVGSVSLSDLRQ